MNMNLGCFNNSLEHRIPGMNIQRRSVRIELFVQTVCRERCKLHWDVLGPFRNSYRK